MKLLDKEKEAIKILESCGWQRLDGAHLEDWNEGQGVMDDGMEQTIEVRSDIAIIKV